MSCCGTGLESKTSHRYIRQKSWRERLVITIGVDRFPFRVSMNSQERKKESFKKCSCCLWSKEINLCVSVSIHLNKRDGKSFQKLISQSSVGVGGAQAGRPEQRL